MKFVVNQFSGIAPRYANRLLKDNQASFTANLKPTSGDCKGFRSLLLDMVFGPGRIFRRVIKFYYPGLDTYEVFLSEDVNADALRSPLSSDAFNRVYFTDKFNPAPQVTTLADMHSFLPPTDLGIPRPATAPGVSVTGGTGVDFTAAYTYIYIDKYGAQGAPAPPTIASGKADGTKTVSFPGAHPGEAVFIDVYRSLAGEETSGSYYKVGRHTGTTGSFADTMPLTQVALQPILDTFTYDEPPNGLQGLVQHSSGAFAGFLGRTVHFSEPYLPHAWPQNYRYTVQHEIVGLAAISNAIIVLTKGVPVVMSGSNPGSIGISVMPDPEPCMSKRSIVVMNNAVIYASPNGLISISQSGLTRPTNSLMTNTEFEAYQPKTIVAAVYGPYYIGFYTPSLGFAVALPPYEPVDFVPLDRYADVTGLDTDQRTDDMYVTQTDRTSKFDRTLDRRFTTTWRSKEFVATKPINLGACQLLFGKEKEAEDQDELADAAEEYNVTRFAEGFLDVVGGYTVAGAIDTTFDNVSPILGGLPPIQPVGGEPLYDPNVDVVETVRFNFYADDKLRYTKLIGDERTHKMPNGYKATRFYLEVISAVPVQRIIVAENARELKEA